MCNFYTATNLCDLKRTILWLCTSYLYMPNSSEDFRSHSPESALVWTNVSFSERTSSSLSRFFLKRNLFFSIFSSGICIFNSGGIATPLSKISASYSNYMWDYFTKYILSNYILYNMRNKVRIAQSVQRLVTCWTFQSSNAGREVIFQKHPGGSRGRKFLL